MDAQRVKVDWRSTIDEQATSHELSGYARGARVNKQRGSIVRSKQQDRSADDGHQSGIAANQTNARAGMPLNQTNGATTDRMLHVALAVRHDNLSAAVFAQLHGSALLEFAHRHGLLAGDVESMQRAGSSNAAKHASMIVLLVASCSLDEASAAAIKHERHE